MRALRYPFSGVSSMLTRRSERAADKKKAKQQEQGPAQVEMLDLTAGSGSYHRKTHSDSSVSSTTFTSDHDSL